MATPGDATPPPLPEPNQAGVLEEITERADTVFTRRNGGRPALECRNDQGGDRRRASHAAERGNPGPGQPRDDPHPQPTARARLATAGG